MRHSLSRLRIALAVAMAALAMGLFPATSYAAASDYWPPYPSNYGPAYSCSYRIRFGDTMSSLAARYGTSVGNLTQMNGVHNPNRIYAGMTMRVPCAPAGYGNASPYPNRGTYSYPGMYPYRGMYSYPNTYSSQCMGSAYMVLCSTGYPYQAYPAQSYPTQVYPMQPYATPGYSAPGYSAPGYATPVPMATPPATGEVMVVMRNIAFNPGTVTIHVGQTVTWRNDDTAPHTTTSGSCPGGVCTPLMGWDSGTLNPGQSFSHQFTTAGTFPYYCRIHGAMMQGTIIVMP
jgi:plastocyanin/LysM repeat protein